MLISVVNTVQHVLNTKGSCSPSVGVWIQNARRGGIRMLCTNLHCVGVAAVPLTNRTLGWPLATACLLLIGLTTKWSLDLITRCKLCLNALSKYKQPGYM